jgi:E3 ubiquitin-protein ligase RNF14
MKHGLPPSPWLALQKLLVLARRKERHGVQDARREADLVNQLLSLKVMATNTRKCPGCGVPTDKVFGCNKMTCAYCGQMWCWRCGAAVEGYDHFSAATCVLFEDDMVRQWNEQMGVAAERMAIGQVRLELPGARPCRCPVCGQHNAKVGRNNLIRCWACNHHFCYSCRTWLRVKVGAHFVSGTCKQHSDD